MGPNEKPRPIAWVGDVEPTCCRALGSQDTRRRGPTPSFIMIRLTLAHGRPLLAVPAGALLGALLGILLGILLGAPGFAQSPYSQPRDIVGFPELLTPPTSLDATDFDGDGTSDLLLAAGAGYVVPSTGGGAFGAPSRVDLGLALVDQCIAGDVDQDGDVDVLALVQDPGGGLALVWSENRGGGDFVAHARLDNAPSAIELRVGDVDNDGDGDFILAVDAPSQLVWFENVAGTIGSQARPLVAPAPERWRLEDVSGDGLNDVVIEAVTLASVQIYQGTGGGHFSAPIDPTNGAMPFYGAHLRDMTGDGLLDIVHSDGGGIQILEGLAPLVFGPPMPLQVAGAPDLVLVTEILDLNADGLLDLVALNRIGVFEIVDSWLPGLGGGLFGAPELLREAFSPNDPDVYADVTGDGLLDAIELDGWVNIEVHQGAGASPLLGDEVRLAGPELDASFVESTDFDGDGDLDLLATHPFASELTLIENLGGGRFGLPRVLSLGGSGGYDELYPADLDGDGDDDYLVCAHQSVNIRVDVVENLGGGLVALRAPVISTVGILEDIEIVDVDSDGDPDISARVRLGLGPRAAQWFRNGGIGSAFTAIPFNTPNRVSFVDVDGDGLDDLIYEGPRIVNAQTDWRRNLGSGVFGAPAMLFFGIGAGRVLQEDVTGDGVPDLLLQQGETLYIGVRNGPSGSSYTTLGVQYPIGGSFLNFLAGYDFTVYDVDVDGDQDVVAFGFHQIPDRSFNFWLNDGTGQLTVEPAVAGAFGTDGTAYAKFADLDGDSDIDIFYPKFNRLLLANNGATELIGTSICGPAVATSAGVSAKMTAVGSDLASENRVTLRTEGLPANQFGIYVGSLTATAATPVAGSQGRICLGGAIGRYDGGSQILYSGPASAFELRVDTAGLELPNGTVAAQPGQTWFFQAWFRDISPMGAPTSNFSDALALSFR